jgi:hypothetical protein
MCTIATAVVYCKLCSQLSMAAAHRLADPEKELLSKTDVFIFDCDGVIWKGDSVIPGIPAVLDKVSINFHIACQYIFVNRASMNCLSVSNALIPAALDRVRFINRLQNNGHHTSR